ncbi:MAG: TIGR02206 family membrane protein [Actinomycetota bacterium]|nr:TIGR02206 family membrane protein [Actinomycetota bacterium]
MTAPADLVAPATNAVVTPAAYLISAVLAVVGCAGVCIGARRAPGPWAHAVARVLGVLLAADAVSFVVAIVVGGTFSAKTSLPLPLCDMAVLVAAAACWWRSPVLVELTYFWGLAGTLQGAITPDLNAGFPHLVFFQYVVGHFGIVMAALLLVVGLRIPARPDAVRRIFGITAAYTALVGLVDWTTGANYMFLRRPPSNWTLLRLLGPWPWYVVSAAAVAFVLIVALNSPFWWIRRRGSQTTTPATGAHAAGTGTKA